MRCLFLLLCACGTATTLRSTPPNAAIMPGEGPVPWLPVSAAARSTFGFNYSITRYFGSEIHSKGLDSTTGEIRQIWHITPPPEHSTGAFSVGDFDGDGVRDVGVTFVKETKGGQLCVKDTVNGKARGEKPMRTTWLSILSGSTGKTLAGVSPMVDKCWDFSATGTDIVYPTIQWSNLNVLFGGAPSSSLYFAPQYATTGWIYPSPGVAHVHLYGPGCPTEPLNPQACHKGTGRSPFAAYAASSVSRQAGHCNSAEFGFKDKCTKNPHTQNGLIVTQKSGEARLVFWTSGRVLQYAVGTGYSPQQLIADVPYPSDGTSEGKNTQMLRASTPGASALVGRCYGLVAVDPVAPHLVWLFAGIHAYSLHADLMSRGYPSNPDHCNPSDGGSTPAELSIRCHDAHAGIERHVSVYNANGGANALQDIFYSYSHDSNAGPSNTANEHYYVGRVVYPSNPFLDAGDGAAASRVIYNVFGDISPAGAGRGKWTTRISEPGSIVSKMALDSNLFVWDVRDLDGDGIAEVIASPCSGYYPDAATYLFRFDPSTLLLVGPTILAEVTPWLVFGSQMGDRRSSYGYLYDVLTVRRGNGCRLEMAGRSKEGKLVYVAVDSSESEPLLECPSGQVPAGNCPGEGYTCVATTGTTAMPTRTATATATLTSTTETTETAATAASTPPTTGEATSPKTATHTALKSSVAPATATVTTLATAKLTLSSSLKPTRTALQSSFAATATPIPATAPAAASNTTAENEDDAKKKKGGGAVAGTVVGVLLGIFALVAGAIYALRTRERGRQRLATRHTKRMQGQRGPTGAGGTGSASDDGAAAMSRQHFRETVA